VLTIGLVLEARMIYEGAAALRTARRIRDAGLSVMDSPIAHAGTSGRVIDADGVIQHQGESHESPRLPFAEPVC